MSSFFIGKCFAQLFSTYSSALKFFVERINIGTKAAYKMLVKLTTGRVLLTVF